MSTQVIVNIIVITCFPLLSHLQIQEVKKNSCPMLMREGWREEKPQRKEVRRVMNKRKLMKRNFFLVFFLLSLLRMLGNANTLFHFSMGRRGSER